MTFLHIIVLYKMYTFSANDEYQYTLITFCSIAKYHLAFSLLIAT